MASANSMLSELLLKLLQLLAKESHKGKLDEVLSIGFTEQEIYTIEQLKLSQLQHLADCCNLFMKLEIDHKCLEKILERVHNEESRMQTFYDFVRLNAPQPMLHQLFNASSNDLSVAAKKLGMTTTKGRTKIRNISLDKKIAIESDFTRTLEESDDVLHTYQYVREKYQISYKELWSVLQEQNKLALQQNSDHEERIRL